MPVPAPTPAPIPLAAWPANPDDWDGALRYGPAVADERAVRLLGNLASKRVLVLGCGAGQVIAETAATGAKVIGVEPDGVWVNQARQRCLERGLMVEVHQSELAELAFVRADTIDVALSVLALSGVADLGRVFRQVHRVLRPDAPLVFSLPHPVLALSDGVGLRTYGEPEPLRWRLSNGASYHDGLDYTHTIENAFTALVRTGFRVDNLLELRGQPLPGQEAYWSAAMERAPAVLVIRARKVGARTPNA